MRIRHIDASGMRDAFRDDRPYLQCNIAEKLHILRKKLGKDLSIKKVMAYIFSPPKRGLNALVAALDHIYWDICLVEMGAEARGVRHGGLLRKDGARAKSA